MSKKLPRRSFNVFVAIIVLFAFAIGIALGNYAHPYEQCARMYNSPEDVSECVWIKENP